MKKVNTNVNYQFQFDNVNNKGKEKTEIFPLAVDIEEYNVDK